MKENNKITLEEFFSSKEELAIYCDTEEKANKLLKEFDKLGKAWSSGDSYLEDTYFFMCEDNTCYTNDGEFCEIKYFKDNDYKIYSFEDIIFEEQGKPKNIIPEIAKMLGVEIGEEFKIKGWSSYPYKFDGVLLSRTNGNEWEHATADDYEYILTGKCVIEKLPKKPKLTKSERVILENLPKEYKWVARNEYNTLIIYSEKPNKTYIWDITQTTKRRFELGLFNHLFQFIKWEDEKPWNIEELLKGE